MAYKQKSSPLKNPTGKGAVSVKEARGVKSSLDFWNQTPREVKVAKKRAIREHYTSSSNLSKNKAPTNFNMTGTSKAGKFAEITKKTGKFLGGKLLGTLSFMGAGTLSATAKPKNTRKGSYTNSIHEIIPKNKKPSIWDNKKKIVK